MSRPTYSRKRVKPYTDILEEAGFRVDDMVQTKHLVLCASLRGQRKRFAIAVSASDHRALKNFRRDVRHSVHEITGELP